MDIKKYCRVCPDMELEGFVGNYCRSCQKIPCGNCKDGMKFIYDNMCITCDIRYSKFINSPYCHVCENKLNDNNECEKCRKKICESCGIKLCDLDTIWCDHCLETKCLDCEIELKYNESDRCGNCIQFHNLNIEYEEEEENDSGYESNDDYLENERQGEEEGEAEPEPENWD